ncbi:hypothetical protein GN958_ATG19646 [Phytophthora infestans]|uniref:CFA20 domain-containing protein n=1 Tax=Phytophthora infestans TaxID=4787 RepID=A0A8S9TRF3_PHYIN|nr:hypothetical protein GN958_ATG19646 [Phytophthora infestans]
MSYFQGGDFVELLSAQGKSPAAAWKLQGEISKTFDKGIKGNAFSLDGNAETKMQLPKTSSSALGLAQRFVILQLLVPFTRSFSVEICFSDFQKVRRRFVVASAFRDTARTTLHVQLPLDVPRDQWMNLVFDLHTLSEEHFPGSGYRSMESICISGSCRLKRIFTMKDAPTPSRGSQAVKHADIRDIPRQFVFSATQRGASGPTPIPTHYFATEASNVGSICGVAVSARSGAATSAHRGQTAPIKQQAKGRRGVHPVTQAKTMTLSDSDAEASGPGHQHSRKLARAKTIGSNLRRPQSNVGKVIDEHSPLRDNEPSCLELRVATSSDNRAMEKERSAVNSVSPSQGDRSYEMKEEGIKSATSPVIKVTSPPSSANSSVKGSPQAKRLQPGAQGDKSLRDSIMGEIQQKIASLEADDDRADQRDRELFLRHTSLHSGEWHLQQLRDRDLNGDGLSDSDEENLQLSSSWRRELNDPTASTTVAPPERMRHRSHDGSVSVGTSISSSYNPNKESIFSFSSFVESRTSPTRKNASKLFDFDSLLQDVKPLTPLITEDRGKEDITQLKSRIESALEEEDDDLELTKLLAAKRLARQLTQMTPTMTQTDDPKLRNGYNRSVSNANEENVLEKTKVRDEIRDVRLSRDTERCATRDRDDWVLIEKDTEGVKRSSEDQTLQDKKFDMDEKEEGDNESDLDLREDMTGLSIDLTSELSASREHELHDHDDESSVDRTRLASPHVEEAKPESDNGSNTSPNDDRDDDSSFDFEDLVEADESIDARDEDEKIHPSSQQAPSMRSPSKSPKQHTLEKRRGPPVPPRRIKSIVSPVLKSPKHPRDKLSQRESRERPVSSSRPMELSSSFSSHRLQSLLESTDWTTELNTHLSGPPSSRSSSKLQVSSSRPQTPSNSSIELVYDPILRCYFDPVANKYYALAE